MRKRKWGHLPSVNPISAPHSSIEKEIAFEKLLPFTASCDYRWTRGLLHIRTWIKTSQPFRQFRAHSLDYIWHNNHHHILRLKSVWQCSTQGCFSQLAENCSPVHLLGKFTFTISLWWRKEWKWWREQISFLTSTRTILSSPKLVKPVWTGLKKKSVFFLFNFQLGLKKKPHSI